MQLNGREPAVLELLLTGDPPALPFLRAQPERAPVAHRPSRVAHPRADEVSEVSRRGV
jgi:hypothetical protein